MRQADSEDQIGYIRDLLGLLDSFYSSNNIDIPIYVLFDSVECLLFTLCSCLLLLQHLGRGLVFASACCNLQGSHSEDGRFNS